MNRKAASDEVLLHIQNSTVSICLILGDVNFLEFLHSICSVLDSKMTISHNPSRVLETKPFSNNKEQEEDKLNCCEECASNYEKEAQFLRPDQKKMLPLWLQSHSKEDHKKVANHQVDKANLIFLFIYLKSNTR